MAAGNVMCACSHMLAEHRWTKGSPLDIAGYCNSQQPKPVQLTQYRCEEYWELSYNIWRAAFCLPLSEEGVNGEQIAYSNIHLHAS